MKVNFVNPDGRAVTVTTETAEVSIGAGASLDVGGLILAHRFAMGAGASLKDWFSSSDIDSRITLHGAIGAGAKVSLARNTIEELRGSTRSLRGRAYLVIADHAELVFHAYVGVNTVGHPPVPFRAKLGVGASFSLLPQGRKSLIVSVADIDVGEGARVTYARDSAPYGYKPCRLVVGANAVVDGAEVRYGWKHQRIVGARARVGNGAIVGADVPDGATVLPGRTVDGNTVFLRDERGTVTVTEAGADCFGNIAESDTIVAYARELYAARVRANAAEAAKAQADVARAKAEAEANAKAQEAERAEQRARSAEGRLDDLRQEVVEARGLQNDLQERIDMLLAKIASATALCDCSRATIARAIKALLSEEGEEYDDAA